MHIFNSFFAKIWKWLFFCSFWFGPELAPFDFYTYTHQAVVRSATLLDCSPHLGGQENGFCPTFLWLLTVFQFHFSLIKSRNLGTVQLSDCFRRSSFCPLNRTCDITSLPKGKFHFNLLESTECLLKTEFLCAWKLTCWSCSKGTSHLVTVRPLHTPLTQQRVRAFIYRLKPC